MSGKVHRIADFAGNAAGHRIALRTPIALDSFLLLQESNSHAALYVGFTEDGLLKVNCQRDGAWQQERQVPLPLNRTDEVTLTFDIMRDHVLIGAEGHPWIVAELSTESVKISGALFCGVGSHSVAAGRPVHVACWEALSGEWPIASAPEREEGVVLVATRWISAAVVEALTGKLPIVVATPMPWHLAELATRFDGALATGKLRPVMAWPSDSNSTLTSDADQISWFPPRLRVQLRAVQEWQTAFGAIQSIYRDVDGDFLPLPGSMPEANSSVTIRKLMDCNSFCESLSGRVRLVRASPTHQGATDRWLPRTALPRLAASPLAKDFLVFS